jgi:hypothetical protein
MDPTRDLGRRSFALTSDSRRQRLRRGSFPALGILPMQAQNRRIRFVIILNLVFTALMVSADEYFPVLKAGSDIYSNVTITAVSATDIYFTYDRGLGNAKLKDLDPALQKHFQYDPEKARQLEQKQATANVQYHLNLIRQPTPKSTMDGNEDTGKTPPPMPDSGKKIWAKSYLNQKAPELGGVCQIVSESLRTSSSIDQLWFVSRAPNAGVQPSVE